MTPDIQDSVEGFMNNHEPLPPCPLDWAVEVSAAEIGHRNLMADFERSFERVFGAPANSQENRNGGL